jgi:hypothetical protein
MKPPRTAVPGRDAAGESGAFVTRRFQVGWADGLVVSRFWGDFDEPPEFYALELQQLHESLVEITSRFESDFVSLVDARSVGEVHAQFGAAMIRMFRRLPRPPVRRAFLVGAGRGSLLQTTIIRAATLGRVRVFGGSELHLAPAWLAEPGTVSEATIRSLWNERT